jgi:uncharacterized protein (TIGR02145 family)
MKNKFPNKVILKTVSLSFILLLFLILPSCKKIEREPKVETGAVTDITTTSAKVDGNIIDLGNGISEHGHFWSQTANMTYMDLSLYQATFLGKALQTGVYKSDMPNLEPGKKYYVRSYIITKNGNEYIDVYGNEVSFSTTPMVLATLTTNAITSITSTTAISGGNITSAGGGTISVRGVCWSTSQNPAISDSHTSDGTGIGSFTSNLTGLAANTTYYVRAYATNSSGAGYGNQVGFITDPIMLTDADGNTYNVVRIGTQLWMTENLKTTKYNDGTNIPLVTDNSAWSSLTTPGYCWYNNDATISKATYGAFYNWYVGNTGKLCPIGWHVPTYAEWTTLTDFLGGVSVAGGKLKSTGTFEEGDGLWHSPNTGANNESDFTALPAGYRRDNGGFEGIATDGYWWSTTESSSITSFSLALYYADMYVYNSSIDKKFGISVRCIKD